MTARVPTRENGSGRPLSPFSAPSVQADLSAGNDGAGHGVLGPDLQKDGDVRLLDGNIVVIARGEVAFRVHKSILSLRSEVFRGLFSLPDAGSAGSVADTIDGAPVVHVSDSPADIRRLFLVICCGRK